jgi:hypothetical protein
MIAEIKTGPQTLGDGVPTTARGGKTGELSVGDAHARFFEAASRGKLFIGADLGGTSVTTQAGLSATTPALTLYNPANSGVWLVLVTVTVDITAAPAAAAGLMLAVNAPTAAAPSSVTNATIQNALTSNVSTGIGQCYRIATLAAAPLAIRFIGGTTGAAAIGGVQLIDDVGGGIIVGPGVALSIQATSAAAIVASFTWEEVVIT